MSRHDVVVVGGANTDYLVRGEHLPRRGETLEGEVFQESVGGKGANQAVAVARLGCRAGLIARVGDDERGARIRRVTGATCWSPPMRRNSCPGSKSRASMRQARETHSPPRLP
jgi:ribokinase